jgi:hypothetical protein
MNWPEIASCIRKDLTTTTVERVGALAGTFKDRSGRMTDGFQGSSSAAARSSCSPARSVTSRGWIPG